MKIKGILTTVALFLFVLGISHLAFAALGPVGEFVAESGFQKASGIVSFEEKGGYLGMEQPWPAHVDLSAKLKGLAPDCAYTVWFINPQLETDHPYYSMQRDVIFTDNKGNATYKDIVDGSYLSIWRGIEIHQNNDCRAAGDGRIALRLDLDTVRLP